MNKAYKFKLKPNSSQKAMMVSWLDMLRSNYNHCLRDRIVNQRTNYQWNVAHYLVRLADVIVLEDLNIQGISKKCKSKQHENSKYIKSAKRALNPLIRDGSWGELTLKTQSVAEKFGCIVLKVNPKFPSQTCSNCGFMADANNQASINIGKKGLEILGISPSKQKSGTSGSYG